MPNDTSPLRAQAMTLRKPVATDGPAIWKLVRACKPLDENSLYANLIQAEHFRDTCVVAEIGDEVVGWISGHIIPQSGEIFVWQVAVGEKARGLGLGKTMLLDLVDRDAVKQAKFMKTTITKRMRLMGAVPQLRSPDRRHAARRPRTSCTRRISTAPMPPNIW